jgi:Flp pilus assembly protein TadD
MFAALLIGASYFAAQSEEDRFREAESKAKQGKYQEARSIYESLLPSKSASHKARFFLGWCYFREGDYSSAVKELTKFLEAEPNSPLALATLGTCLLNLNRFEEAEQALSHSLRLVPEQAQVLKQLGWLYLKKGRLQEADDVLSRSLALGSSDADTFYAMAMVKHTRQDYAACVDMARKSVELRRERPAQQSSQSLTILGSCLLKLNRFEEAEKIVRNSFRLAPDEPEVLKQLGLIYHESGRLAEAESVLRKSVALNSTDPEAFYILASVELARLNPVGAAEMAQRALNLQPDAVEPQILLGRAMVELGEYENAETAYRRALEFNDKQPQPSDRPYQLYGQLLLTLNRLEEAEKLFDTALRINNHSVPALVGRARVSQRLGRTAGARADAEAALKIDPGNETAHSVLLKVYIALGLEDKARAEADWLKAKNKTRLTGEGKE